MKSGVTCNVFIFSLLLSFNNLLEMLSLNVWRSLLMCFACLFPEKATFLLKRQQRHGCEVKSIIFIFLIHSICLPNTGLHTGTQIDSGSLANSIIKQTASGVNRRVE